MTQWKDLKGRRDWLPDDSDWLGPVLAPILATLSRRRREVLYLRFHLDLNQRQAAEILGVCYQRVSFLERTALAAFKTGLPESIRLRFSVLPRSSQTSAKG